jgi:hypothetical protein
VTSCAVLNKCKLALFGLALLCAGFESSPSLRAQGSAEASSAEFLQLIRAPEALIPPPSAKPVVVAIVDDAFRLTHQDLAPFLWTNPREIPGNRVDDDGNGYVDDINGWDVADGNDDVTPPPGREGEFYHGTHLAGIIIQMARRAYGEQASNWIKILPIKALEDRADRAYLKSGYKGIQYAIDTGADIILAAWGSPNASRQDLRTLQSAEDMGRLVVASAGNAYAEAAQYPAAFPAVIAVAAIGSDGSKLHQSSFGGFVDLVAPGSGIPSASSLSDTAWEQREGTSFSAAMVAGAAAILKVQHPGDSVVEITARLKGAARPVEAFQRGEIFYGGKLGAGLIDLANAVDWRLDLEPIQSNYLVSAHQGYLARHRQHDHPVLWRIRPLGEVKGFWFQPAALEGEPGEARMQLFQPGSEAGAPFLDLKLRDWKERLFVPGAHVAALLLPDPENLDFKLLMEYASEPIQQSSLYCRGTVFLKEEGILEDGSGDQAYSPQSDCKWQITAPPGKVIHIEFLEFDTEPNVDWLYFFNGTGTHEKIMAVYSGRSIPPALTTWSNQALLWFVTDEKTQGAGWKAVIRFIDPPASADPSG